MPAAARSSTSGRRAQMATRAPSAAKRSAAARPSPSLPPVMMATLPPSPRSSIGVSLLCGSGAREGLVAEAVRLVGGGAEALLAVGFVVLVVALEPLDTALALEGQHVRGDRVEEPAIVAED